MRNLSPTFQVPFTKLSPTFQVAEMDVSAAKIITYNEPFTFWRGR